MKDYKNILKSKDIDLCINVVSKNLLVSSPVSFSLVKSVTS